MVLATAKRHFEEDLDRARRLSAHAPNAPAAVQSDILRAAWMTAVGAGDAYFSDAYADLVSRTLRAKDLQPAITIPDRLNNLKVPVIAVLRGKHAGWRWRMAARELMEKENVLSLDKIRELLNTFFDNNNRVLHKDTFADWITHTSAKQRCFGISARAFRQIPPPNKNGARDDALKHFEEHFGRIFQRRHDCIHNCDRPRVAIQAITQTAVDKVIEDIEFLISRCHDAMVSEFPAYLTRRGCDAVTRNRVCQ